MRTKTVWWTVSFHSSHWYPLNWKRVARNATFPKYILKPIFSSLMRCLRLFLANFCLSTPHQCFCFPLLVILIHSARVLFLQTNVKFSSSSFKIILTNLWDFLLRIKKISIIVFIHESEKIASHHFHLACALEWDRTRSRVGWTMKTWARSRTENHLVTGKVSCAHESFSFNFHRK